MPSHAKGMKFKYSILGLVWGVQDRFEAVADLDLVVTMDLISGKRS